MGDVGQWSIGRGLKVKGLSSRDLPTQCSESHADARSQSSDTPSVWFKRLAPRLSPGGALSECPNGLRGSCQDSLDKHGWRA